jgi:uncharacterized protein (DUF2236 family)
LTRPDDDRILQRVGGEPVLWFGAQRALLLQLAHPKVAAAVDEHSAFREQPHRRLWSTADTMLLMVWGRPDEADAARAHVHGIHDHIDGQLADDAPPWPVGEAYTAHDPTLLRWVWSTLVDTMEVVYERYVAPLAPDEREALYTEWVGFAVAFGVPAADLPADRNAFGRAFESELEALVVTPTARRVAGAILDPPVWWAPATLKRLGATVATGLLPPTVRDRYGLAWTPADERRLARIDDAVRRTYRHLPAGRVRLPDAYLAGRRTVKAAAALTVRRAGRYSSPVSVE